MENYSYDYYAELFDEFLEDAHDTEKTLILTEEERRVRVFLEALNEKKGLDWVLEKLSAEGLRSIYERNPVEFVLKYCYSCNDAGEAANKYDHKGFLKLWKRLKKGIDLKEANNGYVGERGKSIVTFGMLHDYLQTQSEGAKKGFLKEFDITKNDDSFAETVNYTLVINREFEEIDFSASDSLDKFEKLYHKYVYSLRESSYSVSFYFAKYLYYIVCHQVEEVKNILTTYTQKTPEEALAYMREKIEMGNREEANSGSILLGILNDRTVEQLIYERLNQDIKNKTQVSRVLLGAALNNFVLGGAPVDECCGISILKQGAQLSFIKDQTAIFMGGEDAQAHQKYEDIIKQLSIKDFYGYKINLDKVYRLLFEMMLMGNDAWEEEGKKSDAKEYILGILGGKYDMSRSAVMLYLASAKWLLWDIEEVSKNNDIAFDKDWVLKLKRVNEMLERMGYVGVGDNVVTERDKAIDDLYYEIFTVPYSKTKNIKALSEVVGEFKERHGYDPIPFEMANISAKRRGELIRGNA